MKEIHLSGGYTALVDDCDFDRVMNSGQWQPLVDKRKADRTVYARRSLTLRSRKEARDTGLPRRKTILLHRFILNVDDDVKVDHKDGNGLNNQRDNLRIATQSQNNQNRKIYPHKKYKGTHKNWNKWWAVIRINGGDAIYIGSFETEEEAARAYDKAAREHFGEFARCNFAAWGNMADDIILGARQLKNPKGVKPAWDEQQLTTSKLPGGGTLDISNASGAPRTDMANPPKSEITRTHPLEDHFAKPKTRQHFGAGTVKITEN
jgi:hypothetical protein